MKRRVVGLFVVVALCVLSVITGSQVARAQGQGKVIVPDTTVEHPEDVGHRAHTNHLIFVRNALQLSAPGGETPASLACVYQTATTLVANCPINGTSALPAGGSGVIAIVDAYDYPTAESDLGVFSSQFNLPSCTTKNGCFAKVYANGSKPRANCGWAQEAALDIEWAHAMAPGAKIVLVEAKSNSFADLFKAVDVASSYANCTGTCAGEVSMSWGGSESSSETSSDSHLLANNVVYFAASGDRGGKVSYPSASPNVVSAGGTSVNRLGGSFISETAWSGSGGGPSQYEPVPSYQSSVPSVSQLVGSQRGTPDFSFDANPSTGVSVYDSTSCQGLSGWLVFGGTSVASPSLAGIVNLASGFAGSTNAELVTIYGNLCKGSNSLCTANFRDITSGSAGSYKAGSGWDFVTGVGSDLGLLGK